MQNNQTAPNAEELVLGPADLIDMEDRLCRALSDFLSFSGHAIYFPIDNFPEEIELLPRERRLLLPLVFNGARLGALLLHGVKAAEARRVLPQMPAIARLCLENLARIRAARHEPLSGLLNEAALFASMEHEVGSLRAMLEDPGKLEGQSIPLHKLCLGLVVIRLSGASRAVNHLYERHFRRLARACADGAPSNVLCARLGMHEGRYEIGLLFPATGRGVCHKLAREALRRMQAVEAADVLPKSILSAGHALYPQDMAGSELLLPMPEQARRLRDRARLAARMAVNAIYGRVAPENLIMPYSRILLDGGIILEALPRGRFKTSLGRESNAEEGMRFQVHARTATGDRGPLRGEIVLLEVGERQSLAEILYLEDPAALPMPGDNLARIGNAPRRVVDQDEKAPEGGQSDGEFKSHGEFLRLYEERRAKSHKFVLGIVRLADGEGEKADLAPLLAAVSEKLRAGDDLLAGLYGSNSLIFFHDGAAACDCKPFYENLARLFAKNGENLPEGFAAGLAEFPCLDFDRADMEECALKALEYGILLPDPHIGVFDSLALNISADRHFSLGDIFGAIAEYRQALLADPENAMARNSLGVCMASLKRYAEARRHFLEALKKAGEDNALAARICYNLGAVAQSMGNTREALRNFRKCADLDAGHGYAFIRLGQLYEQLGRKTDARKSFEHALGMENADADLVGTAKRHLAGLCARQHKGQAARELLHEALLQNPNDASSMLLLAGIYLEDNEDPAMVELLARKSAALTDRPKAWEMLAIALRKMGRDEDAREAEKRARAAREN